VHEEVGVCRVGTNRRVGLTLFLYVAGYTKSRPQDRTD